MFITEDINFNLLSLIIVYYIISNILFSNYIYYILIKKILINLYKEILFL